MALTPGTKLGPYQIPQPLGQVAWVRFNVPATRVSNAKRPGPGFISNVRCAFPVHSGSETTFRGADYFGINAGQERRTDGLH